MPAVQWLSDLWATVGWTVTWQLALLALLGAGCQRFLRLRHPKVTHALWWFVLLAPFALAPLRVTLARRQATVSLPMPAPAARVVTDAQVARLIAPYALAEPARPAASPVSTPPAFDQPARAAAIPRTTPPLWERLGFPGLAAVVWALGCLAILVRLLLGHRWVRAMLRTSTPVADPKLRRVLQDLRAAAGLRVPIALHSSKVVGAPVLYGWRRPVIVLPEEWLQALSAADLQALLAHEVAHVCRRDFLVNVFQRVLGVPFFFHPVVWLANRHIVLAREQMCDAWALGRGADPTSYARSLAAAAARAQARFAFVSVGVAERKSTLFQRVEAIMGANDVRQLSRKLVGLLVAALLCSAAAFAAVQLNAEQVPPETRQALADLKSSDYWTRQSAAEFLTLDPAASPAPAVVQTLVGMLGDNTPLSPPPFTIPASLQAYPGEIPTTVAEQAVSVLVKGPPYPAVSEAVATAAATAKSPQLQAGAFRALGYLTIMGGADVRSAQAIARPALLAALRGSDPELKRAAAYTLGVWGDPAAEAELLASLKDPDSQVRFRAVEGLGHVKTATAQDALVAAWQDKDERVAAMAAGYVGAGADAQTRTRLLAQVKDPDPRTRAMAARAVGALAYQPGEEQRIVSEEPENIAVLRAAAADPDPGVRAHALTALRNAVRGRTVDYAPLAPLAADPDVRVRRAAVALFATSTQPSLLPALVAAARDSDLDVRWYAVQGLAFPAPGRASREEVLQALLTAASDPEPFVRASALGALGQVRSPQAVTTLLKGIDDSDPQARAAAIAALGQSNDPRAKQALLQIVAADAEPAKTVAASALGQRRVREAVPALTEVAVDGGARVRLAALTALTQIGDPRAARAFLAGLDSPYSFLRAQALEGIGRLRLAEATRAVEKLLTHDPEPKVRARAAEALGALGQTRAIEPLLAALKDQDNEVRGAAANSLRRLDGAGVVGQLAVLLTDSDPEVRALAAQALSFPKATSAVKPLTAALRDSNPRVRASAAQALGAIGRGDVVTQLLTVLQDKDPGVRVAAARAAWQTGDPRAVAPLLDLLHDPDESLREAVSSLFINARDRKPSPALVPPLLSALKSPDPLVRQTALQALGNLGDRRAAAPALTALQHDPDSEVRQKAAYVLGELREPRAVEPLLALAARPDSEEAAAATFALGSIGNQAAEQGLLKILAGSDAKAKTRAADALGWMKSKAALPKLLPMLQDPEAQVRFTGLRALVRIGADRSAVQSLLPLLDDARVRLYAIDALGQAGDPSVVEALVRFADSPNTQIRNASLSARGRLGDGRVLESLLDYLRDPDYQNSEARTRAVEGVAKIGDSSAVPVLIQALREDIGVMAQVRPPVAPTASPAVAAEVAALRALTGQNLGPDADKWDAWWKEQ